MVTKNTTVNSVQADIAARSNLELEMIAEVYLVFTRDGELMRTRLLTYNDCYYRSASKAEQFANMSRTLIDLGSQSCFMAWTDKNPLQTMLEYDKRCDLTAIKVAEFILN